MKRHTIIRLPEVMQITGMSRSLIYHYVKLGRFPKNIKLGERASGWVLSEVEQWIVTRTAVRDGRSQ